MTIPPKTPIKSAARQSLIQARTPFNVPLHQDDDRETKFTINVNNLPLDTIMGPSGPVPDLGESVKELHRNMEQLKTLHESLNRFNESFAALLHGLKMNAWCVSFPEAPPQEAFAESREPQSSDTPQNHISRSPIGNETSVFITDPSRGQSSGFAATSTKFLKSPSTIRDPSSSARSSKKSNDASSAWSTTNLRSAAGRRAPASSHHPRPSRIPVNMRSSRTIKKKP